MGPRRRALAALAALVLGVTPQPSAQGKRPLAVDNLYDVREVRDPQRSPDGKWVAYTVTRAIRETDKNDTDVWMVSWDGQDRIQLTSTPDNESRPRWSPDGRFLSFVSSRQGSSSAQVWLLNRTGGEAVKLTDVKGGVTDYAWSPDGQRLSLVVAVPDPSAPGRRRATRAKTRRRKHQNQLSSIATTSSPTLAGTSRRAQPPLSLRHCRVSRRSGKGQSRDPDARHVQRDLASLVARQPADRIHSSPSRRR